MDGLFSYTADREQAILIAEGFAYRYRILIRGKDGDIIHDTGNERIELYYREQHLYLDRNHSLV